MLEPTMRPVDCSRTLRHPAKRLLRNCFSFTSMSTLCLPTLQSRRFIKTENWNLEDPKTENMQLFITGLGKLCCLLKMKWNLIFGFLLSNGNSTANLSSAKFANVASTRGRVFGAFRVDVVTPTQNSNWDICLCRVVTSLPFLKNFTFAHAINLV